MSKETKPVKAKSTRGPAPNRLKIKGDWKKAVKKSLSKKKPDTGWPKEK